MKAHQILSSVSMHNPFGYLRRIIDVLNQFSGEREWWICSETTNALLKASLYASWPSFLDWARVSYVNLLAHVDSTLRHTIDC